MSPFTVVYDACVLYPAPLRSFLMHLAMSGLYRALWTNDIHEGRMRSIQDDYPDFTRRQAERIRDLMNAHVADCLVAGYELLIPTLTLPDTNDRHVLASAVRCEANLIVTFNLKDFPRNSLKQYGIEAQHPDDFLAHQFELAPNVVCAAAKRQRQSLKNPPMSADEYLESLKRQGIAQTVSGMRGFAELI